ncbi:MAG: cytochrome c-type biogenesis protein CcmH, partial [Candidatus Tectomicrobia bacterium]|nr:cytochrome c-type biogenesis protein CcmH [Candidatus Tectomicrobia bacterium]
GYQIATMAPAQKFFPRQQSPISRAVLRSTWKEDLYLALGGFHQDGSAVTLKALVRPMVIWIWIGGAIVTLGTFVAVWPYRKGRRGQKGKRVAKSAVAKSFLIGFSTLFLLLSLVGGAFADMEEEVRKIARELRCPVCQNLSVADSPSELARQMKEVIQEKVQRGESPEAIKAYFVSKYGEWVLLSPPKEGFNLLVWVLPFLALVGSCVGIGFALRRWVSRSQSHTKPAAPVDPRYLAQVEKETATYRDVELTEADPSHPLFTVGEGNAQLRELYSEKQRLYDTLQEIEFDRASGKLSKNDYEELRRVYQGEAAAILEQIERQEKTPRATPPPRRQRRKEETKEEREEAEEKEDREVSKGWTGRPVMVAVGMVVLMGFGLALGLMLGQTTQPRMGNDSITGGFPDWAQSGMGKESTPRDRQVAGSAREIEMLLTQGRTAMDQQRFSQAIDAFKKALEIDPSHPEALSLMGFLLLKANHASQALTLFEKALGTSPDYPLALWGKGMALYQGEQNYEGAIQAWERLLAQQPPPEERSVVVEWIQRARQQGAQGQSTSPGSSLPIVTGTVTVASSVAGTIPSDATLFIVARQAETGPPLAVKKIPRPRFPLAYTLTPEDVMLPGASLEGKMFVKAMLKQSGMVGPAQPGDLEGIFARNPVSVGMTQVDIVLDKHN